MFILLYYIYLLMFPEINGNVNVDTAAIAGGVVGGVAFVIIFILVAFIVFKVRQKNTTPGNMLTLKTCCDSIIN